MTLLEVCEPLFQYICRLNRAGRKGASFEFASVRSEVLGLLEEAKSRAASDFKLAAQYKAVELPLIFFVDAMIAESKLPWAKKWGNDRLAFKRDELAGDEKFFDLLDATMKDPSDEASERLTVFFTCLGLGFTGFYFSQPEYLRQKMQDIALRIRGYVESNSQARICPEAYERTDTRDLVEPPTGRVWLMLVIFLICAVTALGCNMYFFSKATGGLKDSLKVILDHDPQAQAKTTPE
jgi:type IV/VI secretion system ImpK/VasF family protein